MTDQTPDPRDRPASDALDDMLAGTERPAGTERLDPSDAVRSRITAMAEVRRRLADDSDAPNASEMASLLSKSIARANPTAVTVSDEATIAHVPPGRSRGPLPWIAATAATLIAVVALSVATQSPSGDDSAEHADSADLDEAAGAARESESTDPEALGSAESFAPATPEGALEEQPGSSGDADAEQADSTIAQGNDAVRDEDDSPAIDGAPRFAGLAFTITVRLG